MPTNPAAAWGEVETLANIEGDPLEADGTPQKAYRDPFTSWRAREGGDRRIRGVTAIIRKRAEAERQMPPGYSGSGNVVVALLPGYRYWKMDNALGEVEHQGRVSCHPDEASQLVGLGSAACV
jgi:hypothetical protein